MRLQKPVFGAELALAQLAVADHSERQRVALGERAALGLRRLGRLGLALWLHRRHVAVFAERDVDDGRLVLRRDAVGVELVLRQEPLSGKEQRDVGRARARACTCTRLGDLCGRQGRDKRGHGLLGRYVDLKRHVLRHVLGRRLGGLQKKGEFHFCVIQEERCYR